MDTAAVLRLSLVMTGLRRALIGLAVAGLVAGLGTLALALTCDHELGRTFVLAIAVGWSFIGAGLYAWWRRPENRTGPLMTLVGFVWFLGGADLRQLGAGLQRRRAAVAGCGSARSSTCSSAIRRVASAPGLERAIVVIGLDARSCRR